MSCCSWLEHASLFVRLGCLQNFPSTKVCILFEDFPFAAFVTAKRNIKALEFAAAICAFGLIVLVRLLRNLYAAILKLYFPRLTGLNPGCSVIHLISLPYGRSCNTKLLFMARLTCCNSSTHWGFADKRSYSFCMNTYNKGKKGVNISALWNWFYSTPNSIELPRS